MERRMGWGGTMPKHNVHFLSQTGFLKLDATTKRMNKSELLALLSWFNQ